MTLIPDEIEPRKGWRTWLFDGVHLRSVTRGYIFWPPGEALIAHALPHENDRCGIYSWKDLRSLLFYVRRTRNYRPHHIIGLTDNWGRVVEHEKGQRSEIAMTSLLIVCGTDKRLLEDIAQHLENTYQVPCAVYPHKLGTDHVVIKFGLLMIWAILLSLTAPYTLILVMLTILGILLSHHWPPSLYVHEWRLRKLVRSMN